MFGLKTVSTVLALLLVPLGSFAATVSDFEGGMGEKIAVLAEPELEDGVNFSLPARCHVLNATVKVSGASAPGGACADGVSVLFNGSVIWAFNGSGYGALGRQTVFSDGADKTSFSYGANGGSGTN
jgi:hypothetical protein